MKVEELIKILQELPKEASVNFQVGDGEEDAYRHAKVQLRAGDALAYMKITKVQLHRYIDDDLDDDMMVDIMLHDHCWTSEGFDMHIKEFDEIAKNIKFEAAIYDEDKY